MPEPLQNDEPTIGRLVHDASRDVSSLVKKEIQLAKSELRLSVKAGGLGIGLFAAAGFLLVLAVIMFSIFLAYLIHWNGDGLALQWAYLIVFGGYVALAGLLAFLGIRSVKKVRGPERAIHQAQETKAALRRR